MPTRPTKGDHGTSDAGSRGRGGQKAVFGSGVDPDVVEAQADAIDSDAGNCGSGGRDRAAGPEPSEGGNEGDDARH